MRERARVGAALAALAVGSALVAAPPSQAQADCPQLIFQFSRATTPAANGASVNVGTFGCVVGAGPDVRYFTPGSTQTSAATYATPAGPITLVTPDDPDTTTIETVEEACCFTFELLDWDGEGYTVVDTVSRPMRRTGGAGQRWSSTYVDLNGADAARASAEFAIKPGHVFSTTYRHLGIDPEGAR